MLTPTKKSSGSTSTLQGEEQAYWTDDLPVCQLSAVGHSTNQIYRKDGHRREGHEFEDRSCHFCVEGDVFLYGVFDGHDGSKTAHFAAQRMPAELLLGQLANRHSDEDIKEVLHQAFVSVEKGWVESIDDALAKKARLLLELPEGEYDPSEHSEALKSLEAVEMDIRGGTTAVVALITNNRLYIANIGCSRALLCTSAGDVLRVTQLTVDHDLGNQNEVSRLAGHGVHIEALCEYGKLGAHDYTRTLGDYTTKTSYRDVHGLSEASSNPLLGEPEVEGGIELDSSCSFLLLFSDGLYQALEEATKTEHVNREIASMVAAEFAVQSTLSGVAQAVVDRVVRIHHDTHLAAPDRCQYRDDITLLVRNFTYPLPNAVHSPTSSSSHLPVSVPYQPSQKAITPLSLVIPTSPTQPQPPPQLMVAAQPAASYTSSNDSTHSSGGDIRPFMAKPKPVPKLPLDEEGRLKAYVDLAPLLAALSELSDEDRAALELKPAYETIPEEEPPKTDSVDIAGVDEMGFYIVTSGEK